MVRRENSIGPSLVYTKFAKGQDSRDLQICHETGDVETQFVDAIDSAYDFFRFLQVSTRGIANIERRLFKDGNQHPGTSGRENRSCKRTAEISGRGNSETGQLCL